MLGRGLEGVWAALCDKALAGDQRALREVLRLSDVPVASSKDDTERTEAFTDEDFCVLEELPEDLQTLCVQHHLSPTEIWGRHSRKLPLSDDELLVAEALA